MGDSPGTHEESASMTWYQGLRLEAKMDADMRIEQIMSDGGISEAVAIALVYKDKAENACK